MKYRKIALLFFALAFAALSAQPSTLSLSVEHHVAVTGAPAKPTLLRTVFADETTVATVQLNVYALPQMPSTSAHLRELQGLPSKGWWQHLQWDIRDATGASVAITPRLLSTNIRQRGPNASQPGDRDTTVPCTSYNGTFSLGRLAVGNYSVKISVAGLTSSAFPLAVRTGSEPEVRDLYLQEKAHKTRDWAEFKSLELERVRLDPTKAAALLELAQQSLEFGTLEETNAYFDRAAKTMEQNIQNWARLNPADASKQRPAVEAAVTRMRALQRVLPEYFANRSRWRIVADSAGGNYVIMARDSNQVIRRVE